MKPIDRPFLPGVSPTDALPLGRFLPPLPSGMVTAWLRQNVPTGEWILDPFGATPALALEIAQAGYRVMVASNNPITSFVLEVLASAPSQSEFTAALAELSSLRRGDERLENHLQGLYLTRCATCSDLIPAKAFLWRKGENTPFARQYHCPHCGEDVEAPVTTEDLDRLTALGPDHLHRARALSRISIEKDLARARAEEALEGYLNRPLYFLFTVMNKIEGMATAKERRRLMQAMVLLACDEGSSLWPWPAGRNRPRQLTTPPQFRETNLWVSLEESMKAWTTQAKAIPLVEWPELAPKEGGISLFKGRLKGLLPFPEETTPRAVIAVIPRPNQAFWTLSALWSGWMWGPEAVTPLKSVLERRRYDWHWHTNALQSTFGSLRKNISLETPVFAVLPELVPGFLSAAVIAAELTGFHLDGIAIRQEQAVGQISWTGSRTKTSQPARKLEDLCGEALQTYLRRRNEPSPYIYLHAACLDTIVSNGAVPIPSGGMASDALTDIQSCIDRVFSNKQFLIRYESQAQTNESGLWWLLDYNNATELPLDDRIEMEVVRYLDKHPGCTFEEIDCALCQAFPGLMTPSEELIKACLESYGEQNSSDQGGWTLRDREKPSARQANLQIIRQRLHNLAERLDFQPEGESPIIWKDRSGEKAYLFYIFASSIIGRFVFAPQELDPRHSILILPGSRSALLAFKLQRDPRLVQTVDAGWRFLKFRHLRRMLDRLDLSADIWEELLDQDPPLWEEAVQMKMFEEE
jgi:hypothetical protein